MRAIFVIVAAVLANQEGCEYQCSHQAVIQKYTPINRYTLNRDVLRIKKILKLTAKIFSR